MSDAPEVAAEETDAPEVAAEAVGAGEGGCVVASEDRADASLVETPADDIVAPVADGAETRAQAAAAALSDRVAPPEPTTADEPEVEADTPTQVGYVRGYYAGDRLAFTSAHTSGEAARAEIEAYRATPNEIVRLEVQGPDGDVQHVPLA